MAHRHLRIQCAVVKTVRFTAGRNFGSAGKAGTIAGFRKRNDDLRENRSVRQVGGRSAGRHQHARRISTGATLFQNLTPLKNKPRFRAGAFDYFTN